MLRLVALVALVGCYHPSFHDCALACATTADCPGGLTCDPAMGRCTSGTSCGGADGGGPDALEPNGDLDGDGVPNAQDNCPSVKNPRQADEDRDGVGDACDPCPISPNNTDTDGDGVADDCDPHPQPIDHLAYFDGFATGVGPGEAVEGTGTASNQAGAIRLVAGSSEVTYLVLPTIATPDMGVTVITAFSYVGTPDAATLGGGGPMTSLSNLGTWSGVGCEQVENGGPELDIYETQNSSYDGSGASEPSSLNPHKLVLDAFAGSGTTMAEYTCSEAGTHTVAKSPTQVTSFDGLFVHGATADFQYVLVVTSGT